MRNPKEVEWAYLAGLIDGEGCISAQAPNRGDRYFAQVRVVNTRLEMLEWIERRFGGVISFNRRATIKWRALYKWRIHGQAKVAWILIGCMPYLVIKRDQAHIALELCNRPEKGRQYDIYRELQGMKQ